MYPFNSDINDIQKEWSSQWKLSFSIYKTECFKVLNIFETEIMFEGISGFVLFYRRTLCDMWT